MQISIAKASRPDQPERRVRACGRAAFPMRSGALPRAPWSVTAARAALLSGSSRGCRLTPVKTSSPFIATAVSR